MGSYSTVSGLYRHKHTASVEDGGSLTEETMVDNRKIMVYVMIISMVFGW